ncbi:uncharacterized protein PITG_05364 [Phytophthora infestans T30-4]|uniref:BUB1 N-terminal domain-containing protein n=1 Tax=Phytophthora infestans (strain T30-4) TaxID=403677 RepID=D0N461_PHYIT|nr:uncharacterized protein PITG_05364 [Phytophthora infestans T30-4]EEY69165.1 conserved hypothetical protein [Phytophthora infestans T30-4]|eukprot:XP_002999019.1 conserved hypothetical protein [Phytophthora infestans T30-4]
MDAAPSDRKRKADAFEWEASKENVMPLKRGRNVADLNKALRAHDSFQTKLRLEDELKTKEEAVEAYDGDDPLAAWLEYVRWLEVKMPEDTRKKFAVLEKCTRELKDNPRYKNDMRYIRLWIQYADLVSNPKDIFKYLYQNKIGERVSLFYIGWAYVLETIANYPQAHKIYLKAGQKSAEPQDLLERKYKEFQRRMSRQWLRMTEETGASEIDEVTHRRALESLSAYGTLELNDAQRQQLHQHRASARTQRIQKANAHKPVFVIYEDPVGHSVDPFDGNGGWKKLGTMQQQDKENEMTPTQDASPLQVFVDDEFSVPEIESKRRTPLTHRSQTLRQRLDGVATEEEMLAQEPLKNFTASDKKARLQKQITKGRSEKPCYNVKQITSQTGEAISFEESRARAYQQNLEQKRELSHRALQNVTRDVDSASNRKPDRLVTTAQSDPASTHNGEQEDMTINTRVALEDINNMFCSPPRQPKPCVWDAKEEDPVERKLHFSIFEDSVDSVALNAQDQSQRQDLNESVPNQTFQVFTDDAAEPLEPRTGKKTCSQKRKPLGARDDLVRGVRLTNKDVIMQAQKDAAEKDSTESVYFSRWIQGATKKVVRKGSSSTKKPAPALVLDPYTYENRQKLILDRRVDWYLCSRPDAVKLHSLALPRVPCTNPVKRKLRRTIVFKASPTLTLQLVGILGSGSFAYVFSAKIVDTASNTTHNKAVKIEKERQNLAWEFYITNKIKKKLRIERGLSDEKIPVPTFSGLHLFPARDFAGCKLADLNVAH